MARTKGLLSKSAVNKRCGRMKKQVLNARSGEFSQNNRPADNKSHKGQKLNTWSPENMENAIQEFRQQSQNPSGHIMSMRSLARAWHIPYRTLRNRLVGKVKGCGHVSGRPPVLSQHEEEELFRVITEMAEVGFPLTRSDIRKLAFEYAEKKNLKCFSERKKEAGYYWFDNFMKRFPQLSVKKAENLSAARAMSVNEVRVKQWFDEYSSLLTKLGIEDSPGHLWNIDETGMQNIHDAKRVVGIAGKHVYNITAMEKGETSTYLAGINAVGKAIPPLIIHKGKTVGKNWKNGAPYNSVVRASPSGWITKEIFLEYGHMFVKFLKDEGLVDGKPHVLMMDNHHAHTFNFDFLQLMKDNNVVVFALPSHTSHILQPLDVVPFAVLKSSWNEQMRVFTRKTGGQALTKPHFFSVFNECFKKAMTVEYAQAGFRRSGLFPVNRNAIPLSAYAPSKTTERPLSAVTDTVNTECANIQQPQSCATTQQSQRESTANDEEVQPASEVIIVQQAFNASVVLTGDEEASDHNDQTQEVIDSASADGQVQPSLEAGVAEQVVRPSTASADSEKIYTTVQNGNSQPVINSTDLSGEENNQAVKVGLTFADLMPIPKRERRVTKRPRAKLPTYNLTSEVHLDFISVSKSKTKESGKRKPSSKKSAAQKRGNVNSEVKLLKQKAKKAKQVNVGEQESDTFCLICTEPFSNSRPKEKWVQCIVCHLWAHEACTDGNLRFVCQNCDSSDNDM